MSFFDKNETREGVLPIDISRFPLRYMSHAKSGDNMMVLSSP